MDSSSSDTSEALDQSPVSTNPSTPPATSSVDLQKLARESATEILPVVKAKNICCVGAGYVGTYLLHHKKCFAESIIPTNGSLCSDVLHQIVRGVS